MLPKTGTTKRKPLSKGQRKHVRRMKEEARKGSMPDNQTKKRVTVTEPAKA